MSAMQDAGYMDESPDPRLANPNADQTNAFKLSEAMLNKKHLAKNREDVKKIKKLMMEMQAYVQEHQIIISQDMVDESRLKIATELLENQLQDRIKREIQLLDERMRPKIKKRLKMKDVEAKMTGKVNYIEFNKQLERIDNNVTIFSDKVEYRLPAMEKQFTDMIEKKANISQVDEALDTKVDKEFMDKLIERINAIEEVAAQASVAAKKKAESSEEEEE